MATENIERHPIRCPSCGESHIALLGKGTQRSMATQVTLMCEDCLVEWKVIWSDRQLKSFEQTAAEYMASLEQDVNEQMALQLRNMLDTECLVPDDF
jgi:primosomal protein N'